VSAGACLSQAENCLWRMPHRMPRQNRWKTSTRSRVFPGCSGSQSLLCCIGACFARRVQLRPTSTSPHSCRCLGERSAICHPCQPLYSAPRNRNQPESSMGAWCGLKLAPPDGLRCRYAAALCQVSCFDESVTLPGIAAGEPHRWAIRGVSHRAPGSGFELSESVRRLAEFVVCVQSYKPENPCRK
jgi:hypothetical protein